VGLRRRYLTAGAVTAMIVAPALSAQRGTEADSAQVRVYRRVGTQASPDSVRLRNDCRLAAQLMRTGQPAPKLGWAWQTLPACPLEAGPTAAVALERLRAATDTIDFMPVRTVGFAVRDSALFQSALDVSADRGASTTAREASLLILVRQLVDGRAVTYAGLAAADTVSGCPGLAGRCGEAEHWDATAGGRAGAGRRGGERHSERFWGARRGPYRSRLRHNGTASVRTVSAQAGRGQLIRTVARRSLRCPRRAPRVNPGLTRYVVQNRRGAFAPAQFPYESAPVSGPDHRPPSALRGELRVVPGGSQEAEGGGGGPAAPGAVQAVGAEVVKRLAFRTGRAIPAGARVRPRGRGRGRQGDRVSAPSCPLRSA